MNAGKPQNQSLAIAYAVKRRNQIRKAKGGEVACMSEGGKVNPKLHPMDDSGDHAMHIVQSIMRARKYAAGGEVEAEDPHMEGERPYVEDMTGEDKHEAVFADEAQTPLYEDLEAINQEKKRKLLSGIMDGMRMSRMYG